MEMFCAVVCVFSGFLQVTEKKKNTHKGSVFCLVTRESEAERTHTVFFDCDPSDNQWMHSVSVCVCVWRGVGWRSGVWWPPPSPSLSRGVRACPWQAAVIRGAQRTEFIRLSRGREAFLPATLQFVSHTWRHVTAWMRFLRHSFLAPMFARRGVCMNRITSFSPSVTLIQTCVAFKDFLRRSASLKNWPLKKCWHRTVD